MTTWFPCKHLEQVRIAQALTAARQGWGLPGSILLAMVFALLLQTAAGFGWQALLWQAAMAVLAWFSATRWKHTRDATPPSHVPRRQIHNATLLGGASGAFIAAGIVYWLSSIGPEFAALSIALLMALPAYAVAMAYFLPVAVAAFCLPLFAAMFLVMPRAFPESAAQAGTLLILGHGVGMMWLLRRNWDRFVGAIDLDVESGRLTDMLRQQKDIAEQAVQLKSRFLAATSHDLRQPMHAISLYLGGLYELELPERVRLAVNDARQCAHDLNDMFRSLLDISRLDAHQAVPNFGIFEVEPMLRRLHREFLPLAESRSVQLKVRSRGGHFYSDGVMAERIAQNFLSNAVRHSPGGRVLVTCRVVRGDTLRLSVYDTGKGIPESQLKLIFNEFHRLDAERQPDQSGGLGLGLAIVRRLADNLRVPIIVRSTPGRGSMFAVELPLVHVHVPTAAQMMAPTPLTGKLVVIIDDEPSIVQAASFILEEAGCLVIGANSGRQALELVGRSARVPDAIICDYELHDGRNGPQVIQDLRDEFNSDIPALLVTGDTCGGTVDKIAKDMGVQLLLKPLESETLRESLGSLLQTQHSKSEE